MKLEISEATTGAGRHRGWCMRQALSVNSDGHVVSVYGGTELRGIRWGVGRCRPQRCPRRELHRAPRCPVGAEAVLGEIEVTMEHRAPGRRVELRERELV